jgi:hypothetical protein
VIPPPSILYWRVRIVFAVYGSQIDTKTNLPLFNTACWEKGNNVLREILLGFISDPPGITFYEQRLDSLGDPKFDKSGLALYDCNRGTNITENVHKQLNALFGSWAINIEFSDKLTAEFRHRYNHNMSQRRRSNFPKFGHTDTWLVDELVNLVEHNHGQILYKGWVKPSSFGDTDEKMGTIPLHSPALEEAIKSINLDTTTFNLSRDMKYLSERMGLPFPVVPVRGEEECKLFNKYMRKWKDYDFNKMAIDWCKYVDCIYIFPKLPVYLSSHFNSWQRNARIRDATSKAKKPAAILEEFNAQSAKTVFETVPSSDVDAIPQHKPIPQNKYPNNKNSTQVVANIEIGVGNNEVIIAEKRKKGRGKGKGTRKKANCKTCLSNKCLKSSQCIGASHGSQRCECDCNKRKNKVKEEEKEVMMEEEEEAERDNAENSSQDFSLQQFEDNGGNNKRQKREEKMQKTKGDAKGYFDAECSSSSETESPSDRAAAKMTILGSKYKVYEEHVQQLENTDDQTGLLSPSMIDVLLASIKDKFADTSPLLVVPAGLASWYLKGGVEGGNLTKKKKEKDEEFDARFHATRNIKIQNFMAKAGIASNTVNVDWIFYPLYSNQHWRMVAFEFLTKSVQLYDSLHGGNASQELDSVVEIVQRIFPAEDFPSWTRASITPARFPTQQDMISCGLYACDAVNTLLSSAQTSSIAYSGQKLTRNDQQVMAARVNQLRRLFAEQIRANGHDEVYDGKWFFACNEH